MAEEQGLSIDEEGLGVVNSPNVDIQGGLARPNLPLPRELRDQIWGYLLYHQYVHAEEWSDRARSTHGKVSLLLKYYDGPNLDHVKADNSFSDIHRPRAPR